MNRFEFLKDSLPRYLENTYITEVVICDETGEDYDLITHTFNHPKLRVYKNERRLGCLRNKLNVLSKATCDYICLFDSDNFVDDVYFQAFQACTDTADIFLPEKALPNFIFSTFTRTSIHRDTLREIIHTHGNVALNLLNTMNCIFTKDMSVKLQSMLIDRDVDTCYAGDSMYILTYAMFLWDARVTVVPGMIYEHRVHDGSYWMETEHLSMHFLRHLKDRFHLQPTIASEPVDTPFWYDHSWNFIDKVVYINLDERSDRKEHMEQRILNVFDASKVQRFPAVKHERGNIGCTRSHIEVLKMAIREGWKNVLILEDDAEWNKYEEGYAKLQELIQKPYDVILLSPSAAQWDPNTMRLIESETSCGYIVSSRYFVTLLKHYEEGLHLLETTGNSKLYVMDEYWKSIQKRDLWYTIIPAMIYQRPGYSDIFCRDVDYRYRVCL